MRITSPRGRALRQVEEFVTSQVLPYYANSHTEASYCGGYMTQLREDARGGNCAAHQCGYRLHGYFCRFWCDGRG